jgi:hypothetical protein
MTYMSHNAYKKTKKGKQEQHRVQDLTGKQPMGGGTGSTFAHTLPAPTSSNSSWMASLSSGSSASNRANRLVASAQASEGTVVHRQGPQHRVEPRQFSVLGC